MASAIALGPLVHEAGENRSLLHRFALGDKQLALRFSGDGVAGLYLVTKNRYRFGVLVG